MYDAGVARHSTGRIGRLPRRAVAILRYIVEYQRRRGAPPTVREIGRRFGIRSTNGVCYYLDLLERGGAIRRLRGSARGIVLRDAALGLLQNRPAQRGRGLPVLGRIAAGSPVMAEESVEGYLDEMLAATGAHFALRVYGDSMSGAGILDGDLVLVRSEHSPPSGSIVVALLDGETTVKRLRLDGRRVVLEPENRNYQPIVVAGERHLEILGRVVGVFRGL